KHRQRFKTALELFLEGHPGVRVIEGESACSGCSCELVSAIRHMKNAGFEREMAGLTVVMGNPGEVRAEGKLALIGECAREFAHLGPYAPGCGPTEDAVIAALCDACEVAAGRVMATRDELRRKLWESTESLLQR
ncbi:MAG: hypothetical protein KAU10_00885, partial [Dehalococcoidia bacterium]|nr:hypothetical protein [Dehalococcoidia bacterium]